MEILAGDTLNLREIVLNTRKPLVLRNFLHNKWTCFQNGLSKWCDLYDNFSDNKPLFERISITDANGPQWERKRQRLQMTLLEFLHDHSEERDYWSGMNYRRKHELPPECTEGVDFGCFGFPHASDDCTFWLGSQGANTPCHYDTYGCNIVAQIFGRKSWLLLPPESDLTTSRIPYEESSVYCVENFYAPNLKDKEHLKKLDGQIYHCILNPNDVLIVPRHWWHFVEALDLSLSINAWIPLVCDINNQIDECITKYLIENFVKDKSATIKEYTLNPNQLSAISSEEELFSILEYLVQQQITKDEEYVSGKKDCNRKHDYQYLEEDKVIDLIDNQRCISYVPVMNGSAFNDFLDTNCLRRHGSGSSSEKEINNSLSLIQETLINSICSPPVVESMKRDFLNRYNKEF